MGRCAEQMLRQRLLDRVQPLVRGCRRQSREQAIVAEHLALAVLGLQQAVRAEHEFVAGLQIDADMAYRVTINGVDAQRQV